MSGWVDGWIYSYVSGFINNHTAWVTERNTKFGVGSIGLCDTLHQLDSLPEDKSQSFYDFLSFFVKCVWLVVGGCHDLSYLHHI